MRTFRFSGRTVEGGLISGELPGGSLGEILDQLHHRGIIPLSVQPGALHSGGPLRFPLRSFSLDDRLVFTRQMQTLLASGVPLLRALQGVMEGVPHRAFREALARVIARVEEGRELSSGLEEFPVLFDRLYCNMIRIGEQTGRLDEAFGQLHRYLEVDRDTRRRIQAVLRYPFIVVGAVVAAMAIISGFVIPTFFEFYARFQMPLPWQTEALIAVSRFTVAYWPLMLAAGLAAVGGFLAFRRTPRGALWWSGCKFSLPVVGELIRRGTLARFARAFGMGARAGVPLLTTLEAVAQAVDNDSVARATRGMIHRIQGGETLTQAAFESRLFPPFVMRMLAVGEETGKVDRMMEDVAAHYEKELEYDVARLAALAEPLVTGLLGIMIFILASGVFLPMWNLVALSSAP